MKKLFLIFLSLIIMIESCCLTGTVFAQETVTAEPENVLVSVCSETAILSWRNPATDSATALSKINLYDNEGGLLSDSFATESGAPNLYKVENLENGVIYTYFLEFVYENGETRKIRMSAKPEAAADLLPEISARNGYYIYSDSAIYEDAAGILFDSEVFCAERDAENKPSKASVKFFGNNPVGEEKSYATLVVEEALYADYEYCLSFWVKSENGGGGRIRFNGIEEDDVVIPAGDMDWTKVEAKVGPIDPTSMDAVDASLEFIMNTNSGGIWIDNIEMFECDGDDVLYDWEALNTTANTESGEKGNSANSKDFSPEELVKKGLDDAATVTAISLSEMGMIELDWEKDVSEARLYEIIDEEDRLVAVISKGEQELLFENLTNGEIYNYRLEFYNGKSKAIKAEYEDDIVLAPAAPDYSIYEPSNILINGGDKNLTISWTNPKETNGYTNKLIGIKLYKTNEDGTESLLSGDFTTEASKPVVYVDGDLVNGKIYKYRLSFVYEDARNVDIFISGKPDKSAKVMGSGGTTWNVAAAIGPHGFTIDRDVFYGEESESSLKFTSNFSGTANFMDVADIPYQKTRFYNGKRYKVEMDVKGVNSNSGIFLIGGWDYILYLPSEKNYDWKHVEQTFEMEKDVAGFFFKPKAPCGTIWIDNLKVYEVDPLGDKIGDDMAEAFSAENIDIESYPQMITAEENKNNITVKWSASDSIDAMKIYIRNEKGTFLRAIAPSDAKETKIGGYGYGEMEIVARAVVGGIESVNTETVTIQPTAGEYEVSEYFITNSTGNSVESVTSGDYRISVKVKNNYAGSNFTAQLFVAQFDENGVMTAVDGTNCFDIYETTPDDYVPTILETDITVNESTEKVTVYLWNSVSGMVELIESRELK